MSDRKWAGARFALAVGCMSVAAAGVQAAHAQQDRGSIAGLVTDNTQSVLQGAQVSISPNNQATTTGQAGNYNIPGLPPGHYTVTVTYLGFQNYTTQVDVTVGAVTMANATLAISGASENVMVRPEREVGEVDALNRQQVADHIVQILPSEVINSLPNTNIADAVGRLPSVSLERDEGEGKYIQIRGTEPRLSNVTIDGIQVPSPEDVRNVKLDAIPADLVDSIELSKTLSANQDGNAIGGSINLVTRKATDQPYFAVEGLLGHTPISGGRGLDEVFATYGRRYGAQKRLGFLLTGSYDWNGRGINDVEPVTAVNPITNANGTPVPSGATVNAPNSADLRNYVYDRTRFGFGGTLDYKLSELSTVYLRGLFSRFLDNGQNWNYTLNTGATSTDDMGHANGGFLTPTVTTPNGNTTLQNFYRTPIQQIWSLAAGAHQEDHDLIWNYEAALSQANQTGGYSFAQFVGPTGVQFGVTQADPFTPQFPVLNGVNIYDPTLYSLGSFNINDTHTFERDIVGAISLARRYTTSSGRYGSVEGGFKYRDVIKGQLYNDQRLSFGGTLLMSDVLKRFSDPNYYNHAYTFGPVPSFPAVQQFYRANASQFTDQTGATTNLPNDWHVRERVYAGYGMNTITFNKIMLQTGVRVEGTTDDVIGNRLVAELDSSGNPVADANGNAVYTVTPSLANTGYTYVLPSIQAKYNFTPNTDARFAYGIGIARPNYGDLAPYQEYDPSSSRFVSAGNPALKPTWAHNLDLLGEKYLKQIGLIQAGVFYKMFYNPIYEGLEGTIQGGPLNGLPSMTPGNGPSAHLIGVEAQFQEHLTFLPGALNGLGTRINYSYTASGAGVPGRADHPALLRDAPQNWNVEATYDKYNISARMAVTHNDAYIYAYNGDPQNAPGGLHGPNGDNYLYPHTQVDAQASYLIPRGRGVSVIASFLNLNNEVFGFYMGSERYPIQREYYQPTYTFGLRWTSSAETGNIFR